MFKRLLLLVISMFLLFGGVSLSFADTEGDKGISRATLSLDKAIEIALENNLDLKRAHLDYKQAIVDAEQARYNANEIDSDEMNSLQQAQTKYVSSKQKSLAKEVSKQEYDIAKEQTKILVEEKYYDVLVKENLVKINEQKVHRAVETFELAEKKYRAGTAVKTDVNQAEIDLESAKADLADAERELFESKVVLNETLGLDVLNETELEPVLKFNKVALPSRDELVKQALEQRLEIKKAKNNVIIAEMNYDWAVGYSAAHTYTARKYNIELEKAKLDVEQEEQKARADVVTALYSVQKAEETVNLYSKNAEQAKENYNLAKRRYEIGVGTYVDVLNASIELADSEAKYSEAVYNFTIAASRLKTVVIVSG